MASESNKRMYELIEGAPKTGRSPTIWAFPAVVDFMKVAGQPVPGPWPPHQEPRPDPDDESLPVAIAEPERPKHALRDGSRRDEPPRDEVREVSQHEVREVSQHEVREVSQHEVREVSLRDKEV